MPKYYHLSKRVALEELKPRVTPKDRRLAQEPPVKRVCLSRSIIGCLRALQATDATEYFVYAVDLDNSLGLLPNKYVRMFVPDAKYTGEVWSIRTIPCMCLGAVKPNGFHYMSEKYNYTWTLDYRKD